MKARVGHEMGNVEAMIALAKRHAGVSLRCHPGDWTEKGEMEAEACEVTEACCGALCKFSYSWTLSGLERALFLTLPYILTLFVCGLERSHREEGLAGGIHLGVGTDALDMTRSLL